MVKSFKHIHNYLSTKNSSDMAPLLCTAEKTLSGMYFNFGSDEETIVKDIVTKSFHWSVSNSKIVNPLSLIITST